MGSAKDVLDRLAHGTGNMEDIEAVLRKYKPEHLTGNTLQKDMALRASQFGYFGWPIKIRKYIHGKRVLDVGCGSGTDAIGFVTLGARSYVGIDPGILLDNDSVKNKFGPKQKSGAPFKVSFGSTPRQISEAFPEISFFTGTFEELWERENYEKFDIVTMHTVTEHLINIEEVFEGCKKLLSDNGLLIFIHDNFYSWNGHHMPPKGVEHIDPADPEQIKYIDWNHLNFDPPEGHYFLHGLNRIRLDDLKSLTERHFAISIWREREDAPERVARLTDEIRARHSGYSERELTTAKVFCVARNDTGEIDNIDDNINVNRRKFSDYWRRRRNSIYLRYVDTIVSSIGHDAESIIDIGSKKCPYLDWFPWVKDRASLDVKMPYEAKGIRSITSEFMAWEPDRHYNIALCLQVMEQVEDAESFGRKLFEIADHLIVSVPHMWSPDIEATHVQNPVDMEKFLSWFPAAPTWSAIVREPLRGQEGERIVAYFDLLKPHSTRYRKKIPHGTERMNARPLIL